MRYPSFLPRFSELPTLSPGLLLAIFVALIATLIALIIPKIGAAPIAIFLGILLGNLYFKDPKLSPGTKFAEGRLLEYSIVFLGLSITFKTLLELGGAGLSFILLQILGTLSLAIVIGKALKFRQSSYLLMAAGNGVCGSSAIAATAPAIGASDKERGLVITVVNLMGTVMMFLLPMIALAFYDSALLKGAFIGGILQSVGQVIASASMLGSDVTANATLFKIMRIASLLFIVIAFRKIAENSSKKAENRGGDSVAKPPTTSISGVIPWYLLGFIIACTLSSLHLVPAPILAILLKLSHGFEVTALAAIGLRLDFTLLKSQGAAFALYALLLGGAQILLALLLIALFM